MAIARRRIAQSPKTSSLAKATKKAFDSTRAKRAAKLTPRPWQVRAFKFVKDHLSISNYVYINAPTGTGKSFLMNMISGLETAGTRMILVGRARIVKQHVKSFRGYGWTVTSSENERAQLSKGAQRLVIMTWQAAALCTVNFFGMIGMLFLDECHIGGSGAENRSIPKVMATFLPAKRIFVSATLQTVKPVSLVEKGGIVPVVAENAFRYPMTEAYQDGMLNPMDLIEVHTGLTAYIKRIESSLGGKTIEDVEDAESLAELGEKMAKRGVTIDEQGLANVMNARASSMIAVYFEKHVNKRGGEQAIFYCPNIRVADQAKKVFDQKSARIGVGKLVKAKAVHTKSPTYDDDITRFEDGETTVLFVVGMLQEGFDLPSLRLVFDCRFYRKWNAARRARLIQKMGRAMRVMDGKDRSLYYFARDITDFYNSSAIRSEEPLDPESDDELLRDASAFAADVLVGADGNEDENPTVVLNEGEIEEIDFESDEELFPEECFDTHNAKLVKTPLWRLEDVEGHQIIRSVEYNALTGHETVLERVYRMAESYKAPFKTGDLEYTAMANGKITGNPLYLQIVVKNPILAIGRTGTVLQRIMDQIDSIHAPFEYGGTEYQSLSHAKQNGDPLYDEIVAIKPFLAIGKLTILETIRESIDHVTKRFEKDSREYAALSSAKLRGDHLYDEIVAIKPFLKIGGKTVIQSIKDNLATITGPFKSDTKEYRALTVAKKTRDPLYFDIIAAKPCLEIGGKTLLESIHEDIHNIVSRFPDRTPEYRALAGAKKKRNPLYFQIIAIKPFLKIGK